MRINLPYSNLVHPITGQPLKPQAFLGKSGNVVTVPVVMGGAPDGDEGGSGAQSGGTSGSDGAGTGTTTGEGGNAEGGDGDSGTGKAGDGTVSKAEHEAVLARMRAADQRAAKLEQDKQTAERAKMDETERTKAELGDVRKENEALKQKVQDLETQVAWSTAAGTVTWHDPEDALAIATRKGVLEGVRKDDGTVDSGKLRKAVEGFVKTHGHLVKDGTGTGDSGAGNGTQGNGTPPVNTATSVGSKGNQGAAASADDATLKGRYRALRN